MKHYVIKDVTKYFIIKVLLSNGRDFNMVLHKGSFDSFEYSRYMRDTLPPPSIKEYWESDEPFSNEEIQAVFGNTFQTAVKYPGENVYVWVCEENQSKLANAMADTLNDSIAQKGNSMKCPICSKGDVIIGNQIANDPLSVRYYGAGAQFATCSICNAAGVVKDGICLNWLGSANNGNPITLEKVLLDTLGFTQNDVVKTHAEIPSVFRAVAETRGEEEPHPPFQFHG